MAAVPIKFSFWLAFDATGKASRRTQTAGAGRRRARHVFNPATQRLVLAWTVRVSLNYYHMAFPFAHEAMWKWGHCALSTAVAQLTSRMVYQDHPPYRQRRDGKPAPMTCPVNEYALYVGKGLSSNTILMAQPGRDEGGTITELATATGWPSMGTR